MNVGKKMTLHLYNMISGPVGIAAAAAINSAKKKRRHYLFETNPAVRKRQQTRLLRYTNFDFIRAVVEKTCLGGFLTGQTQTGQSAIEDGYRLKISDLGSRGIGLSI